tara:strand:+ start:283 stop:987 length:705 start_codon:yes stop_codon:yes gene_type:complete
LLKNKNILITGNTSGIGLELNKLLLKNNNLYCLSRSKSKIKNKLNLKVNISNLKILEKKLHNTNFPKKIDYLILNAGILGKIDLLDKLNISDFEEILKINFLSNKILIDFFIKKKIKLINVVSISSGAAISSKDGWGLYCCSKSALLQLINTYSLENKNIKFISCAPGLAKTKMQDQIYSVTNKNIHSVKKFQKLYRENNIKSPKEIAEDIIKFLEIIKRFKSGSLVDLRKLSF